VAKGEPRRALDRVPKQAQQVVLRLLFDDARHPEFALDLWLPMDEFRRHARPPSAVVQEARSWLSRAEAIMRRARPATAPTLVIADATVDTGARPEPEAPLAAHPKAPPTADSYDEPPMEFEADDQDPFDDRGSEPLAPAPQPVGAPARERPVHAKQLPLL
jgi:hypothetical protein